MATYRVVIKRSAQKEIRDLPTKKVRRAVVDAIRALAEQPRPAICIRLTGADKYRLRVGRYRILYTIRDVEVVVTVVRVAHRKDVYR